jgi:hypothetical protein
MNRMWFGAFLLAGIGVLLLNTQGCARSQQLVAVTLQPSGGFVFEGYNATGQFTAYGTYIHPPVTKDITDKVTWTINIANFGTITSSGLITYTRTDGCGSGEVTASYYSDPGNPENGSVVSGSAPVSGANNANCQ